MFSTVLELVFTVLSQVRVYFYSTQARKLKKENDIFLTPRSSNKDSIEDVSVANFASPLLCAQYKSQGYGVVKDTIAGAQTQIMLTFLQNTVDQHLSDITYDSELDTRPKIMFDLLKGKSRAWSEYCLLAETFYNRVAFCGLCLLGCVAEDQYDPTFNYTDCCYGHSAAWTKPGSATQAPHWDHPEHETATVSVLFCLCDVDDSMGPFEIWPGTHMLKDEVIFGSSTWRKDYRERERGVKNSARHMLNHSLCKSYPSFKLIGQAGTVMFRNVSTWHRGNANRSSKDRFLHIFDISRVRYEQALLKRWLMSPKLVATPKITPVMSAPTSDPLSPVGIGLIGLGLWARVKHIPVLQKRTDCKIVACCVRSRGSAELAKKVFGSTVKIYFSVDEIAQDAAVDVLNITVRPEDIPDVIQPCLRSGKRILTEKPIAATVDIAHQLLKEAKSLNARWHVGENWRFSKLFFEMRRIILSGGVGTVISTDITVQWMDKVSNIDDLWKSFAGHYVHYISGLRVILNCNQGEVKDIKAKVKVTDSIDAIYLSFTMCEIPVSFAFNNFKCDRIAVRGTKAILKSGFCFGGNETLLIQRPHKTEEMRCDHLGSSMNSVFSSVFREDMDESSSAENALHDLTIAWSLFEACQRAMTACISSEI